MEEDRISARQLMVLLAVALLAPATGALPRRIAALAGGLSWLAPLLALPAVLILAWALNCFTTRDLRRLGPIYLVWGLLLLGQALGQVGAQLPQRGYSGAVWLPVALLLGLSLWLAGGKLCTLARGAEIFYLVLALALGAVLLLSLPRAEIKNLAPLRPEDLGGLPLAVGDLLAVLSAGSITVLLEDRIAPRKGDGKRIRGWAAGFCLLLAGVQLLVLCSFGGGLAARLDQPFLALARGIGIPGAFGRIEAAVAALWTLSDLTLAALLTFICTKALRGLLPKRAKSAALPMVAVLAVAAAGAKIPRDWMTAGNLALGLLLPLLWALARRWGERAYIVGARPK